MRESLMLALGVSSRCVRLGVKVGRSGTSERDGLREEEEDEQAPCLSS